MRKYLIRARKYLIGALVGAMLTIGTQAYAAVGDVVEAVFAQFNLVINGQDKTLETVPLVYNGTSYLPVRELSNLVGYDVTYKADSRTIELVTNAVYATPPLPSSTPVTSVVPSQSDNGIVGTNTTGGEQTVNDTAQATETTIDGMKAVILDGVTYLSIGYIDRKYHNEGYALIFDKETFTVHLSFNPEEGHPSDKYQTISGNMAIKIYKDSSYISESDYRNTILPLIK